MPGGSSNGLSALEREHDSLTGQSHGCKDQQHCHSITYSEYVDCKSCVYIQRTKRKFRSWQQDFIRPTLQERTPGPCAWSCRHHQQKGPTHSNWEHQGTHRCNISNLQKKSGTNDPIHSGRSISILPGMQVAWHDAKHSLEGVSYYYI